MGYKIGLVGMGYFGRIFVELFKAHPLCDEVVLCEIRPDVLGEIAKEKKIEKTTTSFDELLKMDIDGVAIFTQRWTHARLSIQALKAGKHVYSAVPAGVQPDELDELVKTVEETGLTYALGETSFYRPQAMWCRRQFAEGKFGRFVYGEGHYYHDMSHWFYLPFYDANGPEWKKYASVPPMWYITHSASHILSTTFSRFTSVSCLGWSDDHEDGIFNRELSAFDNDFANQSALLSTADGGMARINEFRRSAMGESRQCIVGTEGAYEEQANPDEDTQEQSVEDQMEGKKSARAQSRAVWVEKAWKEDPHDENGNYDCRKAEHASKKIRKDMTWIHPMPGVEITEENIGNLPKEYLGKTHLGVGPLHPVERLPKEFVGLANGHCGSHQFLVHDFFEAMDTGKLPPNHVWIGARYSAPAGIAHESSKRGGERLPIPDFGMPPEDKECIDPLVKLQK